MAGLPYAFGLTPLAQTGTATHGGSVLAIARSRSAISPGQPAEPLPSDGDVGASGNETRRDYFGERFGARLAPADGPPGRRARRCSRPSATVVGHRGVRRGGRRRQGSSRCCDDARRAAPARSVRRGGRRVDAAVSRTGQRLLARIALSDGVEDRAVLAGVLWPEHPRARAQANLRGAVWRLPASLRRNGSTSGSACSRSIRLERRPARGRAVAPPTCAPGQHCAADILPAAAPFRHDLLPDWDESWLLVHRERYRQLRLHALERTSPASSWTRAGRSTPRTARCSRSPPRPLRESGQRLLVCGHLAAGNRAAARASYERFRRMLADELGVQPSPS